LQKNGEIGRFPLRKLYLIHIYEKYEKICPEKGGCQVRLPLPGTYYEKVI
jgi:hypothetical protein